MKTVAAPLKCVKVPCDNADWFSVRGLIGKFFFSYSSLLHKS